MSSNLDFDACMNCLDQIAAKDARISELEAALGNAGEALEKIIIVDQHESIYPRGPSIAKEALAELRKVLK